MVRADALVAGVLAVAEEIVVARGTVGIRGGAVVGGFVAGLATVIVTVRSRTRRARADAHACLADVIDGTVQPVVAGGVVRVGCCAVVIRLIA